jgi:hypothetical protein
MRRIVPAGLFLSLATLAGCGSHHYYRNVGVGQPSAGPSLETHVGGGIPGAAVHDEGVERAGTGRLSRDAVPDSVMLREQADAGFRDTQVPQ